MVGPHMPWPMMKIPPSAPIGALLLPPDHPLDRGGAPAAVVLGPVQAGPAGVGLLLLPGLGRRHRIDPGDGKIAEAGGFEIGLQLARRVGVNPAAHLGAKDGFLGGVIEVHGLGS